MTVSLGKMRYEWNTKTRI